MLYTGSFDIYQSPAPIIRKYISRYGRGASIATAFELRYALIIPQESGVSGSNCWRFAADLNKNGQSVEAAGNLATPDCLCPTFDAFAQTVNTPPFYHRMTASMIAPRGLYVIDNLEYVWLGPESNVGCMAAA
ncbi:carbohydrate-binding module 1 [Pseudogymnoascus australis]